MPIFKLVVYNILSFYITVIKLFGSNISFCVREQIINNVSDEKLNKLYPQIKINM